MQRRLLKDENRYGNYKEEEEETGRNYGDKKAYLATLIRIVKVEEFSSFKVQIRKVFFLFKGEYI